MKFFDQSSLLVSEVSFVFVKSQCSSQERLNHLPTKPTAEQMRILSRHFSSNESNPGTDDVDVAAAASDSASAPPNACSASGGGGGGGGSHSGCRSPLLIRPRSRSLRFVASLHQSTVSVAIFLAGPMPSEPASHLPPEPHFISTVLGGFFWPVQKLVGPVWDVKEPYLKRVRSWPIFWPTQCPRWPFPT